MMGALLIAASCERFGGGQHLIKSKEQREAIATQAAERESLTGPSEEGCIAQLEAHGASSAEVEAVQFLYAHMPLCDLGAFPLSYIHQQAQTALEARNAFKWGKKLPNDLFLHYVLPFRVANEQPDEARIALYNDLKDIASQHSAMGDAALEVAHWCREQAGPNGTVSLRTSGPQTTMRAAQGHQREMSVLLVSALRAVSIPARAVDGGSSAWAEAWADGQWYAIDMGAPALALRPVKDHRVAAARTIVPGAYTGSEAQLLRSPYHTELNLLPQREGVRTLKVKVLGSEGRAAAGAYVELQQLCNAGLIAVASGMADGQGVATLQAGPAGELLLWASQGQQYGLQKVGASQQGELSVQLGSVSALPQGSIAVAMGKAQSAGVDQRTQQDDLLRAQRVASYIDSSTAAELAHAKGVKPHSVCRALRLSRGNWEEVHQFVSTLDGKDLTVGMALLDGLDERDLQSASAVMLRSHLAAVDIFPPLVPVEQYSIFDCYVLAPRIGCEPLEAWREPIHQHFSYDEAGFFRNNPELVAHWLREHVRIDNKANYAGIPMSPLAALRLGVADEQSRDILFVAICRSFGIPSRLNPSNQAPQYMDRKGWHTVFALSSMPDGQGRINLSAPASPQHQCLLSRLNDDGSFVPVVCPPLPAQVGVEQGVYRVVTYQSQHEVCGLSFVEVPSGGSVEVSTTL